MCWSTPSSSHPAAGSREAGKDGSELSRHRGELVSQKMKLKEFVFLILQKERPRGDVSGVYKYIRWQEPVRRIKLKSRWI